LHDGGRQRADPGVELLFGQLGGKAFTAPLPEINAHCGHLVLGATGFYVVGDWREVVIHSFGPGVKPPGVPRLAVQVFDGKGIF